MTSITRVDWDQEFVQFAKTNRPENMGSLVDPRTNLVFGDALAYVTTTDQTYDGVIIDLPDPDGDEMEAMYIDLFFDPPPRSLIPMRLVTAHVGPVPRSGNDLPVLGISSQPVNEL